MIMSNTPRGDAIKGAPAHAAASPLLSRVTLWARSSPTRGRAQSAHSCRGAHSSPATPS